MFLKAYEPNLYPFVEAIQISPSDSIFTKTPIDNIISAQHDKERHPILVMENGSCVAFFTLHEGNGPKDYANNRNAVFFRSFSVDCRYRGRGIGKKTIQILPKYVKKNFPEVNEITLAVNTDNLKAIHLYCQAGYIHTYDSLLVGRPVHIMKYYL